jgi:hypothetical protein
MPLIGNVTNHYYTNVELLVEILDKINRIDMALQPVLTVVEEIKVALAAEVVQINERFDELLAQIAALDNSEQALAIAEDLRTNVLAGIQGIIPDEVVDPPVEDPEGGETPA